MKGESFFKSILVYSLLFLGVVSCKKEEAPSDIICQYPDFKNIEHTTLSLFPIKANNTWTFIDTVWNNHLVEHTGEVELKIEQLLNLDGAPAAKFNQLLPLITLKNDTLFSTELTPELKQPNCYRFTYPIFFNTTDSVLVDQIPSARYVYPSHIKVETPAGDFTDNIIFNQGNSLYITLNPKVGVVKYNLYFITNNGIRIPRRSLTLKSYTLY